ncbi:MAG: hypothetical protein P8Y97_22325, partial [Candidatus Lokiarchaeota archaeon]
YKTKGINNKNYDKFTVSQSDIEGLVVDLSRDEIAFLEEMALRGRITLGYVYAKTDFSEMINEISEIFDDNVPSALSAILDDFNALLQENELTFENFLQIRDRIKNLRVSICPFQQLVDTLSICYKYLKSFVAEEFNVFIDGDVKDFNKAFSIIRASKSIFSHPRYGGMEIYQAKVSIDDLGTTNFKHYPSGKIKINLNLDLEIILNNILPHELGHIKIRTNFDEICKVSNIVEFWMNSEVKNEIAIEIEEFLIDANNLKFLSNEEKIKYAKQQINYMKLYFSPELNPYNNYIDILFNEMVIKNNFPSISILQIARYLIIMEYIKENILVNDPECENVYNILEEYYEKIIDMIERNPELNNKVNEKLIDKFLLSKFRSYLSDIKSTNYGDLMDYLTSEGESDFYYLPNYEKRHPKWLDYICNYLFPKLLKS